MTLAGQGREGYSPVGRSFARGKEVIQVPCAMGKKKGGKKGGKGGKGKGKGGMKR